MAFSERWNPAGICSPAQLLQNRKSCVLFLFATQRVRLNDVKVTGKAMMSLDPTATSDVHFCALRFAQKLCWVTVSFG